MIDQYKARYRAALHAMQSGVAMVMNYNPKSTDPKHLRTGVNSAMVETSTLAQLLIDKGVITSEEFASMLADKMEAEVQLYVQDIEKHTGKRVILV